MQCFVYRSDKKLDTYVYLRERDAFAVLPPQIVATLGELGFVLEVALTPERKLARGNTEVVRANLAANGFHIQFPPKFVGTSSA